METIEPDKRKEKAIFFYDKMMDRKANTVRLYRGNKGEPKELVVKGFYKDDFHLSIANQWNTGDSTMVKQVVDRAAGLVTGRSGQMTTHYADKFIKSDMGKDLIKGLGDSMGLGDLQNTVQTGLDTIRNYQHSAFFTADDFYKSFKGTTVTMPTSLQLTLMSDEYIYTNSSQTKFNKRTFKSDVFDYLKRLLDVSVGNYEAPETLLGGWVGIQNAPNGFKTGSYNLNEVQLEGSLTIHYGDESKGGFVIKNMLVSNVHFTFSKTKVEIGPSIYRPLYIDVTLTLEPAVKFTKKDIIDTIGSEFKKSYYNEGDLSLNQDSTEESRKALKEKNNVNMNKVDGTVLGQGQI